MQPAARPTVHTAEEIKAVEQVARRGADAAKEIQNWTERLSTRAQALEAKVGDFFDRVRTDQPHSAAAASDGPATVPRSRAS
jgi:hypothetical protein